MTETVIYTFKGVRYHLGYIHQTVVNGKLKFVLIPSFEFRPPFVYPLRKGALNRFYALASIAIAAGKIVPVEGKNIYLL
ncbi:MAG TPA: hypothetical protein VHA56_03200 [Mucilaginibacter sp.]|nr:hypothetical protein [Mucilaginibacter sp.]